MLHGLTQYLCVNCSVTSWHMSKMYFLYQNTFFSCKTLIYFNGSSVTAAGACSNITINFIFEGVVGEGEQLQIIS